jgi:hypothetical protein
MVRFHITSGTIGMFGRGDLPLRQVHMGSLQTFIAKRKGDRVKASTINGALAIAARHILKVAGEKWMDDQGIT